MGAIRLWVRSTRRQHRLATVFLALVAGLSAATVAASTYAAGRADTAIDRYLERNRAYDVVVFGCPPGADPVTLEPGQFAELCATNAAAERLRTLLAALPEVEATTTGSRLVVGVLDPSASNGWGRLVLMASTNTPGAPTAYGRAVVTAGRLAAVDASDEVVIGEAGARRAGIGVGDVIQIASWTQGNVDAAVEGLLAPETTPVETRVVGVVRYLDDVQPDIQGNIGDTILESPIYAGPAWFAAHGANIASYGSGVGVRLRTGREGVDDFIASLGDRLGGWFTEGQPIGTPAVIDSVQRTIDVERQAVLIFAVVAAIAGVGFVGLAALRQLRREFADRDKLTALGFMHRDLMLASAWRALSFAAPAALVAMLATVAVSPFVPVGSARRIEFGHPFRADVTLHLWTMLAVVVLFAVVATVAPGKRANAANAIPRRTRFDSAVGLLGPVPQIGANFARGGAARAAVSVTAIALAAAVTAGVAVASLDRVIDEPVRYGAWWDVTVGQYSQLKAYEDGVAKLAANPAVLEAAAYSDLTDNTVSIDSMPTLMIAAEAVVGDPHPVVTSGRAPSRDDEIALGRTTARKLGKTIGDSVTVTAGRARTTLEMRVVGIAIVTDPISTPTTAGDGAYVTVATGFQLQNGGVPQSIAVRLDPKLDRSAAIESVRQDFPGSIRVASPQADTANLARLRRVPWMIVVLIGVLATATFVHTLVTLLARRRRDLAVLAALGMRRGERRSVCVFTAVMLVASGALIGIPGGLVLGRWFWQQVATRISIASDPQTSWGALTLGPLAALAVSLVTAVLASWRITRGPAAALIRVE